MRKEYEAAHAVSEEVAAGPPSRRANATLTPCPNGNHLWCIGGEFFNEDKMAFFYNDIYRYTPEKDEWRKFISPTCPGPRSAHAVVGSPAGGGKLYLFGGEFSSLYQNTFHHYRDFWVFDITTHAWDRIDLKAMPTARSGHRMAMWKHFIVLFGGFNDPGIVTKYLNDLWVFDTQEYKWTHIEFKENENKPSPRSGFSFLPTPDGIVLHGGYCLEYAKGKRPVGVMLEDTWFLRMTMLTGEEATAALTPAPVSKKATSSKAAKGKLPFTVKWEKRKRPSTAFAPSLRSGCTMALWAARGLGVMFGGVTDEDTSEENMRSVFHNDLFAYQLILEKGKWSSLLLRKPKSKKGPAKKKAQQTKANRDSDSDDGAAPPTPAPSSAAGAVDFDDPTSTTPMPRYNAMLAVLRNMLYIYGGIFERGSREYTLDDFYALALDKMDRYVCLKQSDLLIPEGEESSSSGEDGDDDEDDTDSGSEAGSGSDSPLAVTREKVEVSDDDSGSEASEGRVSPSPAKGGQAKSSRDTKRKVVEETAEAEKKSRASKKQDKAKATSDVKVESDDVVVEVEDELRASSESEEEFADEDDRAKAALREKATAFMGVAKDTTRSQEDIISTPLPGERLAGFYQRSKEHWVIKARNVSDNRGKALKGDAFNLCQARYKEYKPLLKEIEKILAEAGLDEDEIKRAGAGTSAGAQGQSRNRR
ncbi:galactose oxidase [Peniophora sp. CONT]|nr:galactose oxidase [Peniophora sp. CONT]